MSDCCASRSTIFPLPSSPHCAPTTTVAGTFCSVPDRGGRHRVRRAGRPQVLLGARAQRHGGPVREHVVVADERATARRARDAHLDDGVRRPRSSAPAGLLELPETSPTTETTSNPGTLSRQKRDALPL